MPKYAGTRRPANEKNSSNVTALGTSKWLPTMSLWPEAGKKARDQGLEGGKKATSQRETDFSLGEGIESEGALDERRKPSRTFTRPCGARP